MAINSIVSEADFVGTYPDGERNFADYNTALRLRKQSFKLQSIADAIGRHWMTTYQWISDKRRPYCVKGLDNAKDAEIVPLTTASPKLTALRRLYSWAFWTGSVSKTRDISIVASEEQLEKLKSYFGEEGLDCHIRPPAKKQQTPHLWIGDDNKVYGRVLECMGFPTEGRKSVQQLEVPESIMSSQKASSDFLQVLFHTRRAEHHRSQIVYLHSNKRAERAEEFGEKILDLIQCTLPLTGLTRKHTSIRSPRKPACVIAVHKENRANFALHYPTIYPDQPRVLEYQSEQNGN